MKRVNFHLEDRQIEWLEKRSEATGVPVAWMIRAAVDDYREKTDPRKSAQPRTKETRS